MEQLSNALALQQLGYATVSRQLSAVELADWLARPPVPAARPFADVARALALWLADGATASPRQLAQTLWRQTGSSRAHRPPGDRTPLPVPASPEAVAAA